MTRSADGDLPPVWPDPDGEVRGATLEPLHKAAPKAARRDPALHELLALIDALRDGRVRERQMAEKERARGCGGSSVADPNRALFESVVRLLAPVLDELVFVGGCTTGLFISDPAAGGIRPTKDVDAIVDVTSHAKYAALSERLRALGLAEDTTPDAPLCRWRRDDLIVDVMPVDEQMLGFSNRWYPAAIETARTIQVSGHSVRVVTPALFIATKIEGVSRTRW